ncbi:MAG TPA: VanW family protein, partial [Herpetosiphonaceae bacterium]
RRFSRTGALALLAACAALVALSVVANLRARYDGRFGPSATIGGLSVQALTPAEARPLLEARAAAWRARPLAISFEGRRWEPTLEQLGASLDFDRSLEAARSGSGGGLAFAALLPVGWQPARETPLYLTVDQTRMRAYLESIAPAVARPPRNAGLLIGAAGATVQPAQIGRIVLIDETIAEATAALASLEPRAITLRVAELPPLLDDSGVAGAAALADHLLSQPLELRAAGQSWQLGPDELRPLLRLRPVTSEGRAELRLDLEPAIMARRLAAIAPQIARPAVNPRLRFANGQLTVIKPGQQSLELDQAASLAAINANLGAPGHAIELVVTSADPPVSEANLDSLGIREAVGVGRSSFANSAPYRVQNIKAGSALLDGLLIAPGAEFSFNNAIGAIDASNGFTEGYAIVQNRTQLEYGGGICQDSTTLFRAAFYAGLPFTEWHHHSFRISWYEVFEPFGMDATIFTGQSDLRFVNDTGAWLLLQTEADDQTGELTYALYGTKPDREVLRGDPVVGNRQPAPPKPVYLADAAVPPGVFKQTDTARGGMDITIKRIIKQGGQVTRVDSFVTKFKPWPNIFLHNPRTPAPRF